RHKARPAVKRTLIFIRHGQYDMAPKARELHLLTALGHEQAALVAERLQRMREEVPAMLASDLSLFHSDMPRAVQTTEPIKKLFSDVPVQCLPDLAEGRPCVPQPSRTARKWSAEQVADDGERIERAFRTLVRRASESAEKDEVVVVVCHANVIRYFVCRALQLPPEAWLRMSLPHGSLTTLCVYPVGRVSLQGFGDAGHLP
ncbi:histidine phosphatase superfamily, partial [Pavlovales sp. CCMP2436]